MEPVEAGPGRTMPPRHFGFVRGPADLSLLGGFILLEGLDVSGRQVPWETRSGDSPTVFKVELLVNRAVVGKDAVTR